MVDSVEPHQRSLKFSYFTRKRLLQQYRSVVDAGFVRRLLSISGPSPWIRWKYASTDAALALVDGRATQSHYRRCAENAGYKRLALRSGDLVAGGRRGPTSNPVPALSSGSGHGDDICGCTVLFTRIKARQPQQRHFLC
jgi:hypothetical protein